MVIGATTGDDVIHGTPDGDVIDALAGNDLVYGHDGDDVITGNSGNDTVDGGYGADQIYGGDGYDTLIGGDGDDILVDDGTDDAFNSLDGGYGSDRLSAYAGFAVLSGGGDDDLLKLMGWAYGNLDGGDGNDVLIGGIGSDELRGGYGYDVLTGGEGKDVFAGTLVELDGDIVTDYEFGELIRITQTAPLSLDDVRLVAEAGQSYLGIDLNKDGYFDVRLRFADLITGMVELTNDPYGAATIRIVDGGGYGTPTEGDDYIIGSIGDDTIDALGGNDQVQGSDGNDVLLGGSGDDVVDGGAGADVLEGGDGFDQLYGGDGDDQLNDSGADWGESRMYGGAGDDILQASTPGTAQLFGEDGDDQLLLGAENTGIADGGSGMDTLVGGDQADILIGGADADIMTGGGGADAFDGYSTDFNGDVITDYEYGEQIRLQYFSPTGRVVLEAAGADSLLKFDEYGDGVFETTLTLSGISGGEVVITPISNYSSSGSAIRVIAPGQGGATEGADLIAGSQKADSLDGLGGDDEIFGLGGDDLLFGGAGDDTVNGGTGADQVDGGAGLDTLLGGDGDDILADTGADGANNFLYGGEGADQMSAMSGHSWLYGEAGDDTLSFLGAGQGFASGGDGVDRLIGGARADRLQGGAGADILTGGGATDYFEDYAWNFNGDVITDYEYGETFYFFQQMSDPTRVQLVVQGSNTLLKVDSGGDGIFETTITLNGVFDGRITLSNNYVRIVDDTGLGSTAPTGANRTVSLVEDGSKVLTINDFGFADAEGHSLLAVRLTSVPASGVLRANGVVLNAGDSISAGDLFSGLVTYTPGANVNGPNAASFSFQVQATGGGADLDLTPNTMTFSIATVNDAPVASGSASLPAAAEDSIPAGATVASLFAANFSDAADQVAGGSGANSLAGVAIVGHATNAAQGVWQYSTNGTSWTPLPANLSPGSALLLSASTHLRFLPAADFNGAPAPLSVVLVDSSLGAVGAPSLANVSAAGGTTRFSAQTVNLNAPITPVNDAPTAPATAAVTTAEDTASAHILIGAIDRDGDPVSFALKAGAGPAHGSVSFTDAGFVYTPTANYAGADNFILTISDGKAIVEQAVSVTVTPVNDAPRLVSPYVDQDARQGAGFQLALGAAFADADGDTLTYTVTTAAGGALPSWMTVSGGVLSGTPTGAEDLISLKVTAKDAAGLTVSDTFDLYVGRVFNGGANADRYTGGRGDDLIFGNKGNDELNGAAGDDLINGGLGNDILTGGLGADLFVVGSKAGADRINDMQLGLDHIRLDEGVTVTSWQAVKGNTVIQLSGGGSITLVGLIGLTAQTFVDLFE